MEIISYYCSIHIFHIMMVPQVLSHHSLSKCTCCFFPWISITIIIIPNIIIAWIFITIIMKVIFIFVQKSRNVVNRWGQIGLILNFLVESFLSHLCINNQKMKTTILDGTCTPIVNGFKYFFHVTYLVFYHYWQNNTRWRIHWMYMLRPNFC